MFVRTTLLRLSMTNQCIKLFLKITNEFFHYLQKFHRVATIFHFIIIIINLMIYRFDKI